MTEETYHELRVAALSEAAKQAHMSELYLRKAEENYARLEGIAEALTPMVADAVASVFSIRAGNITVQVDPETLREYMDPLDYMVTWEHAPRYVFQGRALVSVSGIDLYATFSCLGRMTRPLGRVSVRLHTSDGYTVNDAMSLLTLVETALQPVRKHRRFRRRGSGRCK